MKTVLPILFSILAASQSFAGDCGKVTAVESVVKMALANKKYDIHRPQRTIETDITIQLDNGVIEGWAVTGDQVALGIAAFQNPERYELCVDGSPYDLESNGQPDSTAIKVSLKKLK